jgi:hypothetical protein
MLCDSLKGPNHTGEHVRSNDAGSTIYVGSQPKRQKTQAPKEPQAAAAVDPDQPWELQKAQPWADKEVAPAVLNDEQKAYLEQVN